MPNRPNIVFLLNDHHAFYGHESSGCEIMRPYFDAMCSEGVRYERAYTSSPLCGPARRSILTGLYSHTHRELYNDDNHPFDRECYLDTLAAGGYRNLYFGKWHAGPGTAIEHGCEGFSYPSYGNPYTTKEYKEYLERNNLPEPCIRIERNLNSRFHIPSGSLYRQQNKLCNEHATGVMLTPKETHEAYFLARTACEAIRDHVNSGDDRPFALRVDFWGPHQPYFPTPEFVEMYDEGAIPEYPSFRDNLEGKPEVYRWENNSPLFKANRDIPQAAGRLIVPNPLPWSEWQRMLALCYAQISLVDAAGGLILETLEKYGLSDDTVVVWTADHGDAIACHGGHFDKAAYMPEEMLRIPMAVRYPGRITPGTVSDSLVSNLDVPVTILDVARLSFHDGTHGVSLLDTGSASPDRSYLVCETHGHPRWRPHYARAVVTQRYKYVYNEGQREELYDLESDPYEMRNICAERKYASELEQMRWSLAEWRESTDDIVGVGRSRGIDG